MPSRYAIAILINKLILPRLEVLNLTTEDLARLSFIDHDRLIDFISTKSDITLHEFLKILTALQINPHFVAKEDDDLDYSDNTISFN